MMMGHEEHPFVTVIYSEMRDEIFPNMGNELPTVMRLGWEGGGRVQEGWGKLEGWGADKRFVWDAGRNIPLNVWPGPGMDVEEHGTKQKEADGFSKGFERVDKSWKKSGSAAQL